MSQRMNRPQCDALSKERHSNFNLTPNKSNQKRAACHIQPRSFVICMSTTCRKGPDMTGKTKPVQYEAEIGGILAHLGQTHVQMRNTGLLPQLSHLIELRISQINDCAFCVKMHSADARKDGESNARLDHLAAWRHVSDFTPAEKAAFAWAEALTYLDRDTDYAKLRGDLRTHYSDQDVALITTCVSMINLWNRMQISKH